MPAKPSAQTSKNGVWPKMFAGFTGAWLGLTLLKFGNPVILDQLVEPPDGFWEWVFNSWPVGWGYWMLAGLAIAGATLIRCNITAPRWPVILPLIWWGWQLLAATQTVDAALTRATMLHFTACIVCFYLGLIALSRVEQMAWFWMLLLAGFVWMLWMGFGQHFGGLESTLQMIYQQPDWRQLSPEYLKRVASTRIFSTLVYPNALAGAILLFLPMLVARVFRMTARLANIPRGVLVGLLGYAGLACLYWSGSKSGWIILLAIGLVAVFRLPLHRQVKLAIVALALIAGLAGFFVKFSDYFRRGATSVTARFDYWRAAWQITRAHPVFGTGPGTFSIPYKQIKAPQSEMTRLVHNNFLEQASPIPIRSSSVCGLAC
ncbi:MAG: hypothetical protein DME22_23295 [Verrucomicrobia bacterium]|nr:MAG: hypothetical protein DME22_23295 [Verrucomicrobiota bacterium]